MLQRAAQILASAGVLGMLGACATPPPPPPAPTQAFGQPESTIPWNQPQSWEGGGAGLNALRGNEEGR